MSEQPTLEVAIRHRAGALLLDVAFTLTAPWTVLFGPSGAGKSTVLRAIAGLVRPEAGRIAYRDQDGVQALSDAAAGVFLPPHRRMVRLVGQQTALFPHRTVRENIAFGMAGGTQTVEEIMQLCRIAHVAGSIPSTISGGERQRVVLARTLGAMPARAVLLDEPFSGLDTRLRDELMQDVRTWITAKNIPVLHVTHDLGEAFGIDAEVIRIANGRVEAQGAPGMVLREAKLQLLRQLGSNPGEC